MAGLVLSALPVLGGVAPPAAGLSVSQGLGLAVVGLLLLVLGVHVGVGLRVLLARHVEGVPGASLLGVVVGLVVGWVHGLVGVGVLGSRRHGPAHVLMAVVWVRGAGQAVLPHRSVPLALGVHRRVLAGRGGSRDGPPPVGAACQWRLVGRGAVALLLQRACGAVHGLQAALGGVRAARVPPSARGLRGPLIPAVGRARLGGQLGDGVAGGQRGERDGLGRRVPGTLGTPLGHPVHRAGLLGRVLGGVLWRGEVVSAVVGWLLEGLGAVLVSPALRTSVQIVWRGPLWYRRRGVLRCVRPV